MFTATCPPGIEDLLEQELTAHGAQNCVRAPGAVHFAGPWDAALTALLWARLPSRVLWTLGTFAATSREELYAGAKALPWPSWLHPGGTLSVHCARGEGALDHTHFVALVLKDAVVDAMREATGERPSIDTDSPDARLLIHIKRGTAVVSFDLSGESLHRRGYRMGGGEAPLKENVAAAMLLRSGWPHKAAPNHALFDPMCGSGTLLIEGALMAAGCPANAHRARFGVEGLRSCDRPVWRKLRQEATLGRERALAAAPKYKLHGRDIDPQQLRVARAQAAAAGVGGHITLAQGGIGQLMEPPANAPEGCLITNPPFGARLGGTEADVRALMGTLGEALRRLPGYDSHVLVADVEMGFALGMQASRRHSIMHGPLQCTLLHLRPPAPEEDGAPSRPRGPNPHVLALANRLRKNVRALAPYLQEQSITAYRLYDSDLPEYAVAIDVYQDELGQKHAHIQEYAAPKEVPESLAQARLRQVLQAVGEVLDLPSARMALKVRRRQRPTQQYGRGESRKLPGMGQAHGRKKPTHDGGFWVQELGLSYFVDLHTYVDSGLFLDHRKVRAWMMKHASGKRVLNLFGYTGSVSVAAAAGGAKSTTTVDLSATYLTWAEDNFERNRLLASNHRFEQADCLQWVQDRPRPSFELAFVNPPTHSNSKRMEEDFDIVRDHAALLRDTMRWVTSEGTALFTTHAKKLRMDEALLEDFAVTEISRNVRPKDFDHAKNGCRAWLIRHRPGP